MALPSVTYDVIFRNHRQSVNLAQNFARGINEQLVKTSVFSAHATCYDSEYHTEVVCIL